MFDLGWGELLVVGVVALVVLGPKELPNALRTISNLTKTARKLAGEFQSGVNEIVREADLEEARKVAQGLNKGSISKAIEKAVDPTGEMKSTIKTVETEAKGPTSFPSIPNPAASPTVARTRPVVEGPTVQRTSGPTPDAPAAEAAPAASPAPVAAAAEIAPAPVSVPAAAPTPALEAEAKS
jgi:sec-independent protein translocase protein TatB